jgi:hypothetical protein
MAEINALRLARDDRLELPAMAFGSPFHLLHSFMLASLSLIALGRVEQNGPPRVCKA